MSKKVQAPAPRKGQAPKWPMAREEFGKRFRQAFYDPAFELPKSESREPRRVSVKVK